MAKKVVKVKGEKSKEGKSFFGRRTFEIILFVFSFLLYSNSIFNDYNMDDELVTNNHRLTSKGVSAIPEIFTSPYYQDNMGYAYEYRPVVLATFAIEHQLFGDNPHVSHFINVMLYSLCCVLLYLVLLNISSVFTPVFSFLVALFFAAHSSHTEVVCSIKNRDEILGLIFCLLSVKIVMRALKKPKLALLALLPFVFALALMNKMTFLPFAFIIILAVVLFTDTRLSILVMIAALLAIPGFFIIQSTLFFKLMVTLAIPVGAIFIYYAVRLIDNSNRLWQHELKWKDLFSNFISQSGPQQDPETSTPYSNSFRQVVYSILPPRAYFSFTLTNIVPLLILALYTYGIITGNKLLCLALVLLLALMSFGGKGAYSWWATLALYIAMGVYTSGLYSEDFYSIVSMNAILLVVVLGILYDARKFGVPSVLLALLFISKVIFHIHVSPVPKHGVFIQIMQITAFFVFYLSAFAFIFKRGKNIKWGLLVLLAVNLAFVRPDRIVNTIFDMLVISAALFVIMEKVSFPQRRYFLFLATTVAILFMIVRLPVVHPATVNTEMTSISRNLKGIDTTASVNLIKVKQERPINFVEQPVSPLDPWSIRAGTSMVVLFHYFTKVIVPYPMAFYYGYKFIVPEKITGLISIISIVIYLILFALLLYFLRYNKAISFGIGIYLISIITFSNYFISVPGIIADRFLLTASLGWCVIIITVLYKIFKVSMVSDKLELNDLPKGFRYAFASVLVFYSVITFSRNFDWKNYTTLSKHDIDYVENSSQANNLLALNLMQKSYAIADPIAQKASRIEALEHFKKSLDIYPRFYNVAYDIARVYNTLNENDSSIAYFKMALAIDSTNPNPALFIGQMLNERAQYVQAIPYLEYAVKHTLNDYSPYDKLSFAYFKMNDYNRSIETNQRAIAKLVQQPAPYINIARVYIATNQMDSARAYLQKAQSLNPGDQLVQQLLQQTNVNK